MSDIFGAINGLGLIAFVIFVLVTSINGCGESDEGKGRSVRLPRAAQEEFRANDQEPFYGLRY
jgi:hypothetical protein